ncbi:MAG: multidrug MFS transporter [Fluviicola sp.]|nr:MAG: multidrug MFS transporter [Fluviicola sp.]
MINLKGYTSISFVLFHKREMKLKKKIYITLLGVLIGYFVLNSIRIYQYSFEYSEDKSDVAIVLGAASKDGILSPVFKERINHGVLLYEKGIVNKIIFTGGIGKGQKESESKAAKNYALRNGVPESDIFIEEKSNYTTENLEQAEQIMDSLGFTNALLVSDPLHMRRAMKIAKYYEIDCKPSPTKTTMYKSSKTKLSQLLYETFFFSLREPLCLF